MAPSIIKEASEISLKPKEMPGLFPVSKIKPNKKVRNTWEEVLKKTWYAMSPPTQEAEIGRKWFVIVYKATGAATLFIAKVNK